MASESRLQFGPLAIESDLRSAFVNGEALALTPKAFDLLLLLAENSHRVVPKSELLDRLWPDTAVEEANLTQTVFMVRKALGEAAHWIVTLPKVGYRFGGDAADDAIGPAGLSGSRGVPAGDRARAATSGTHDLAAYELFLLARHQYEKRTVDGLYRSIDYAQRAVERDPAFARAHATLAASHVVLGSYTTVPPGVVMREAERAATRALALDPAQAEAHASLGFVYLAWHWRWAQARHHFEAALAIDPQHWSAHQWYSFCHVVTGDIDRAVASVREAQRCDPYSQIIGTQVGWILYFAQRYDEAIAELDRVLVRDPNYWRAFLNLSWCHLRTGRADLAVESIQRARELNQYPVLEAILAMALAGQGQRDHAVEIIERLSKAERYISHYWLALAWLAAGEVNRTFDLLEEAVAEREWFVIFIGVEPALEPIRANPRMRQLIERVGIPERDDEEERRVARR